MNERLLELAEDASLYLNAQSELYELDLGTWVHAFAMKFGEYMVDECIVAVKNAHGGCAITTHDKIVADCVVENILKSINAHFGVRNGN